MQKSKIQNFPANLSEFKAGSRLRFSWLSGRILILAVFLTLALFIYSFAQDEDFIYDAKGKRNPFIALVTPDGQLLQLEKNEVTGDLALEGIIYDERGLSYAIVNTKVVKIGDTVDNYQVLKIEKNKVIFIRDGQSLEVELKKEEYNEDPSHK